MRRQVLALAALILFAAASPTFAEPRSWTVDPDASRLTFQTTQLSAPFDGGFKSYGADVTFDPDDLAASRVRVEIDVTSIDTGNAERDTAALGPDWFDSANHLTALFETTSFTAAGDGRYEARAKLTIRGETRDVVLPFTLGISEDQGRTTAQMSGELTISRGDFGVGRGQWAGDGVVGDSVVIRVEITAHAEWPAHQSCAKPPHALRLSGFSPQPRACATGPQRSDLAR